MKRKKKDVSPVHELVSMQAAAPAKRMWVIFGHDVEVMLPGDAPARKDGQLCSLNDCSSWDDVEVFYNERWQRAEVMPPKVVDRGRT